MSSSPFTEALEKARGGGKRSDWLYFTVLPVIIAIFVVAILMVILLKPVENRREQVGRQNRVEAVQEYENDRKEGGVAAGVHRAATPEQTGNSTVP